MHKLEIARREVHLSIAELSELSGVCQQSIRKIESVDKSQGKNRYKTREDVAQAVAAALYRKVGELFDPIELSHRGRPAKTGKPVQSERSYETTCTCGFVISRYAGCDICDTPAQ